jgi:hypothetical protein
VAKENGATLPVRLLETLKNSEVDRKDADVELAYDDFLMQQIDDKTLRKIFNGLCKS